MLDRRISTVDPGAVPLARRLDPRLVMGLGVFALAACSRQESSPGDDAGPVPETHEQPAERGLRWRFLPTLEASLPDDVSAVPILELGLPHRGKVRIVVAAFHPGQMTSPRVEVLDFDQNNERDKLEPEGGGTPILRLAAEQPRSKELDALRRQMAAPQSEVYRPLGHDVAGPEELVAKLVATASIIRDDRAEPRARAQALAELVRGLDDAIVFERDELHAVLDAMGKGPLAIGEDVTISARRRSLVTTGPGRPLRLEIVRASGGWALASLTPTPPAP